MTRAARALLPIATILVALPAAARAQETQVLSFVNAGKTPPPVSVFAFTNAGKVPVGATDADGNLTIRPGGADFQPGDRVAIWVKRCEGGRVAEVILTPENAEDPCPPGEEAAADEACGCEKLGVFVWGRGNVVVDLAEGAANPVAQRPPGAALGGLPNLQFGLGAFAAWFPNMENACDGDGIDGCDSDDVGVGFQAVLEYFRWLDRRLGMGVDVTYTPGLQVDQRFMENGGGLPERHTTDLDIWTASLRGIYRRPLGPAGSLAMFLGLVYVCNIGDLATDHGFETVTRTRHDHGLRIGGGVGYDWWFRGDWGLRTEVGGMIGDDGDVDSRFQVGWKLLRGIGDRDGRANGGFDDNQGIL